ncbi:putative D-amino-acid oxidase, partial [Clarias magur]
VRASCRLMNPWAFIRNETLELVGSPHSGVRYQISLKVGDLMLEGVLPPR